jgi:hypothetical protein
MTDSRSDHVHDEDELLYDWEPEDDEPLPKRPRRRLVTPVSAALAGAIVAALGFIGGVEVQKGQDDGSSGNAAAAQASAGAGGGGAGRGGFGGGGGGGQFGGAGATGQSAPTVGSVANKKGSTLYVKDSDGNLVKVKTTSHSKINRTASTSTGAIHPGDTVIVQGTTSKDGTVTATQVNATASGATGGLGGLFGRFGGGGGPPQGGAASQGGGAPQGAPGGG